MSYITLVEYQTLFPGDDIAQSDFDVLSDISSNIVNRCTYGKIDGFGISEFTETLQTKIKESTIYQVKTLFENGGIDALYGQSDLNAGSVSIGKYSETISGQGNFKGSKMLSVDGVPISPLINIKLLHTGLLNSSIGCYSLEVLNERNP